MPVSLQIKPDLGVISLLSILEIFADAELQAKPYLVKEGIKIIL